MNSSGRSGTIIRVVLPAVFAPKSKNLKGVRIALLDHGGCRVQIRDVEKELPFVSCLQLTVAAALL
jgi:hypothetical protein